MVEPGDKEAEYNHKFGNYAMIAVDYILLVGRRHTEPIREGVAEKDLKRNARYSTSRGSCILRLCLTKGRHTYFIRE